MRNPFERPAYLERFQLKEPPYTTNPDERYLFLTDEHEEAIHMCGSIIANRQGIGLIVGEKGTGKTTIMRRLNSLMLGDGGFHIALIETADHCPTIFQLVKDVLESFGQECVGRDTKARTDQLKAYLLASYAAQKSCVLLIDEAQQMSSKLLESIRGLLNFEDPKLGGKLLQIILFGMPEINRKLKRAHSLRNRLVKTELAKMSRRNMEAMLKWRFQQANGRLFPFEPAAIQTLFTVTQGNPRSVCGIAQVALEYAGLREQMITAEVIQTVAARRMLT